MARSIYALCDYCAVVENVVAKLGSMSNSIIDGFG